MSPPTHIKVCCIASLDEAVLALYAGADALGFVSAMPSGPGPIAESKILEIVSELSPDEATFLLTCETTAGAILAQLSACRVNTLQLVDRLPVDELQELRAATSGIDLVQVIHVCDETAIDEALEVVPQVDALLLDSGNPKLAIKQLGGTGRTHDWKISRRIRDLMEPLHRPVWLAGGLTPHNVPDAIRTVRPHGVDICSGVRTGGHLDPHKLTQFVEAVRVTPSPQ